MVNVIEKTGGSKERRVFSLFTQEVHNFEEPKTTKKVQKGNRGVGVVA